MESKIKRLEDLDNYTVHQDDTDVRGYVVKTEADVPLGKVDCLIASTENNQVLYLEVDTSEHIDHPDNADQLIRSHAKYKTRFENDGDHFMLIPVGLISIDKTENEVTVHGYRVDKLHTGPRHNRKEMITSNYELDTHEYYIADDGYRFDTIRERRDNNKYLSSDFYKSPVFIGLS